MASKLPIKGCSKNLANLVRYAVRHGWDVSRTSGGHVRFIKPGCAPVFTGFSASDRRAELNAIKHLRHSQARRSQS